jgi:Fucose permease
LLSDRPLHWQRDFEEVRRAQGAGWYSAAAVALCLVIFAKLGWVSVICVFLTYFFMSIMFPTIFALGIFGLGQSAKKASSFIVMAIMGGPCCRK